ncbi:putative telomere repeats-binding bouquet formation protein 1, partial [Apostichopus japonicus]
LSSRCELLALVCPACCTRTHLHSKSFVKTLMSSQHVCNHHRNLVSKIKDQYHRKLHNLGSKKYISSQGNCDVYSFSEDEKLQQAFTVDKCEMPLLPKKLLQRKIKDTTRRQRQDFSEGEIRNLMKGVKRHGKHWNAILWTYHFKKGRTGIDLKDKYRRLV